MRRRRMRETINTISSDQDAQAELAALLEGDTGAKRRTAPAVTQRPRARRASVI